MPRKLPLFVLGVAVVIAGPVSAKRSPKDGLPCVNSAEEQGMDSAVLARGLRELSTDVKHLHSLLIARNGCLVVEAYWPSYNR